jgi:hypothetical protein
MAAISKALYSSTGRNVADTSAGPMDVISWTALYSSTGRHVATEGETWTHSAAVAVAGGTRSMESDSCHMEVRGSGRVEEVARLGMAGAGRGVDGVDVVVGHSGIERGLGAGVGVGVGSIGTAEVAVATVIAVLLVGNTEQELVASAGIEPEAPGALVVAATVAEAERDGAVAGTTVSAALVLVRTTGTAVSAPEREILAETVMIP